MKIKTGGLFLALGLGLSVVITGCASGPDTSASDRAITNPKPTGTGDDHDQPVYTSPATTSATNNLPAVKSPP